MARNRFLLAAGTVMAIIVAVGVFMVVSSAKVHTVAVVVAKQTIPARTQITRSELTIVHLPSLDVPRNATGNVLGRWTIHTILSGQPIQRTAIQTRGSLTYGLAVGDRAFSVPVSTTTAAGGQITPGITVDVITVTGQASGNTSAAASLPTAQTLIQDVTILSVQQPSGSPQQTTTTPTSTGSSLASPPASAGSSSSAAAHYIVTLAVTSGQAQQLAFALGVGDTIYIAVRPPHASDLPLSGTTALPSLPEAGPAVR